MVHLRSLTKPAAPGLRVAALLARGPAAARLRAARIVEDFFVAGPLQEAAIELVGAPGWPRHLRRVRTALRERQDALVAAVAAHLGPGRIALRPRGGMHLWVALDDHEDDVELAARAARAGVIVSAGRHWFPAEPPAPAPAAHLRDRAAGAPRRGHADPRPRARGVNPRVAVRGGCRTDPDWGAYGQPETSG